MHPYIRKIGKNSKTNFIVILDWQIVIKISLYDRNSVDENDRMLSRKRVH